MTQLDLISNINFDQDYDHTIDFENVNKQYNYFTDLVTYPLNNFQLVRINEEVRVEINLNLLSGINYVRYTNTINGIPKTFYAFVVSKEYVNQTTSRLILEVDYFQTYMFDYEIKQSFVNREHHDRFLINMPYKTITRYNYNKMSEDLDYGNNYIIKSTEKNIGQDFVMVDGFRVNILWYYITSSEVIGSSHITGNPESKTEITTSQGNMTTNYYTYVLPMLDTYNIPGGNVLSAVTKNTTLNETYRYISTFDGIKKLSELPSIVSIQVSNTPPMTYTTKQGIITGEGGNTITEIDFVYNKRTTTRFVEPLLEGGWNRLAFSQLFEVPISEYQLYQKSFNTYIPITIDTIADAKHEPKLDTNPYKFLKLKSGDTEKNYNIEDFDNLTSFVKIKSVSNKGTSMIIPKGYRGTGENYGESLITIDENNIAVRNNLWNEYESRNKSNLRSGLLTNVGSSILSAGISTGVGVATGNPFAIAGAITTAVGVGTSVANEMIKRKDIKQSPDTLQTTGDDIMLKHNISKLQEEILIYTIQEEYRERLFRYFQAYGYKTNELKIPYLKSRYYFNYIQTNGVNIVGNLDTDTIRKIKQIYDRGTTIWHYRDENTFKGMYNYDYENVEMSAILLNEEEE